MTYNVYCLPESNRHPKHDNCRCLCHDGDNGCYLIDPELHERGLHINCEKSLPDMPTRVKARTSGRGEAVTISGGKLKGLPATTGEPQDAA